MPLWRVGSRQPVRSGNEVRLPGHGDVAQTPNPAEAANVHSSGPLISANSREGVAIFTGYDLTPGQSRSAEVRIANMGAGPEVLVLSEQCASNAFAPGELSLVTGGWRGTLAQWPRSESPSTRTGCAASPASATPASPSARCSASWPLARASMSCWRLPLPGTRGCPRRGRCCPGARVGCRGAGGMKLLLDAM